MDQNQNTTTETSNDKPNGEVENKEPSKWGQRLKTAAKWTATGILFAGAGAAGFFGMKYYIEHKS